MTAVAAAACGAGAETSTATRAPSGAATDDAADDAAHAPDTPPDGLDEAQGRALLAARFRGAGLRVKYDVRLTGPGYDFTVDGFDPARGVGFEYIAVAEAGVDLSAEEIAAVAADAGARVLVVHAAPAGNVAAAARRFLAALDP